MTIKKAESASSDKKPKKKPEKQPTLRQQKAIKIAQEQMVENGWKITKWKILEKAWYPPSTQNNPDKVFASASMKKALKKAWLDMNSLKMKHKELLNSTMITQLQVKMSLPIEEFIDTVLNGCPGSTYLNHFDIPMAWQRVFVFLMPDKMTQTRALDMAYKILWEYAPEKHEHTGKDWKELTPIVYIPDNNRTKE